MKSLISDNRVCWVCGTIYNLHKHHIFGGANRKKSDKDGCWVYLCGYHHNLSDEGVHFNRELDLKLKRECETNWLERNGKSEDDFIREYGKNYL